MTAFLPPNLLALFAARDPIPYLPPADKLSHEKKRASYGGVSQYLKEFEVILFYSISTINLLLALMTEFIFILK